MGLALAAAASIAGAAAADEPRARLDAIEGSLQARRTEEQALERRADDLAAEIDELREMLVDVAAAVQDFEQRLHAEAVGMTLLEARIAEAQSDLGAYRAGLGTTLAALVRIARHPPEALLARPGPWRDTVHGVRLLEHSVDELSARTDGLARELAGLRALRAERETRRAALAELKAEVADRRAVLRRLLERKSSLQATLMSERRSLTREIAALGAQARDVRELIESINRARAEAAARRTAEHLALAEAGEKAGRELAEARRLAEIEPAAGPALTPTAGVPEAPAARPGEGEDRLAALAPALAPPEPPPGSSLPFPVHGKIVRQFGETLADGGQSPGLGIATQPGSQVVAPRDGEVVFAGPFRSYGQLLILEHAGGYHSLLSGFSRLDCEVGQHVRAGEPLGRTADDAEEATILYMELRHDSRPVDPEPWLMSGIQEVRG
jgi:septal ring factor EnvC (AmiA/AmiB activator)